MSELARWEDSAEVSEQDIEPETELSLADREFFMGLPGGFRFLDRDEDEAIKELQRQRDELAKDKDWD